MTVSVDLLDDRKVEAWDRFVLHDCPEATFFHRSGWKGVVEKAFSQKAHFLLAERDGAICGVLPLIHMKSPLFGNRLVSLSFTVGGGVAAMDDDARAALDQAAVGLMEKLGANYVEYRQPSALHAEGQGWAPKADLYYTFEKPILADEAASWKQIPSSQRTVVKKAIEQFKLVDEVDRTPDRFFPIYAETMRDLGTPVFGKKFFRLIMDAFGSDVNCLTVSHQGVPVASSMNFRHRERVMLYFLGNLPAARQLGATNFLIWRLFRRSAGQGLTLFDYGRSKVDTGPYKYKKNWGFQPRAIANEFRMRDGGPIPEVNPTNPKYARVIALWQKLPLPVANLLGPHVIRHIG